jgi:hypothetical protein
VVALALLGTLAPFTLFAFGQSRVSAEVAGAFLNLEPLVGALAGAVAFGDPVGLVQVAGGLAILGGIGLSSVPLIAGRRAEAQRVAATPAAAAVPTAPVAEAEALVVEGPAAPPAGIATVAPDAPARLDPGERGVLVVIRGGKFGPGSASATAARDSWSKQAA